MIIVVCVFYILYVQICMVHVFYTPISICDFKFTGFEFVRMQRE